MPSRKFEQMMWAEACEMIDRAERLQREFFRPGSPSHRWEPPVDIYETPEGILIVVALPGANPSSIQVIQEGSALIIEAERRLPAIANNCSVNRLEIPHGQFQRRLTLAPGNYYLTDREWSDGCLYLHLRIA